jgi:O-antigen ligase
VAGAVVVPFALNRFVFGKIAVVALALAMAMTIPPRGRLTARARVALVAAAVVIVGAVAAGAMPLAQALGRGPRYEGLPTLGLYLGCCAAGARLLGPDRTRGAMAWFLRTLAVVAVVVGVQATCEAHGLHLLRTAVARPGGLLGNASDLGAWSVLALGPVLAVAVVTHERLFMVATGALGAAIVVAASRGALLGSIVVAVTLAAVLACRRERVHSLIVVIAILAAALALPATRDRVTGTSPYASRTVSGRADLWWESMRLIADRPALGVGVGGYIDALPGVGTERDDRATDDGGRPDSPHNWPLQVLAAGGIPLLLIVGWLLVFTARRGIAASARQPTDGEAAALLGLLAGLAGYAAALLTHFTSPGTTPLAATFAGVLLATRVRPRPGPQVSAEIALGRGAASALAGAIAMVALAAALAEIPLRVALDDLAAGRLTAAEHQLDVARAFRPWDSDISGVAAYGYMTLAVSGKHWAARLGQPWSERELRAVPESINALDTGWRLATLAGDSHRALELRDRARAVDPQNPIWVTSHTVR